jgi:hypothetical protein
VKISWHTQMASAAHRLRITALTDSVFPVTNDKRFCNTENIVFFMNCLEQTEFYVQEVGRDIRFQKGPYHAQRSVSQVTLFTRVGLRSSTQRRTKPTPLLQVNAALIYLTCYLEVPILFCPNWICVVFTTSRRRLPDPCLHSIRYHRIISFVLCNICTWNLEMRSCRMSQIQHVDQWVSESRRQVK